MQDPAPSLEEATADLGIFLERDGWHPVRLENSQTFRVIYSGTNGTYPCLVRIMDDQARLLIYVQCPIRVTDDKRPAAAEFLTRANFGLFVGNFELDFRDGEVRFKSSVDFTDLSLPDELIRNAIYPAVRTSDRYFPGLLEVVYGDRPPLEAVQAIEESPGDSPD